MTLDITRKTILEDWKSIDLYLKGATTEMATEALNFYEDKNLLVQSVVLVFGN